MAEYWGLDRIAKRLGFRSQPPVIRLLRTQALPIYKRTPADGGRKYRGRGYRRWYTNDDLLRVWELERSRADREEIDRAGKWKPRSWYRQREREAQEGWAAPEKAAPHESGGSRPDPEAA